MPDFTWRQRKFIQWAALPKEMRPENCKTHLQVAEILHLSPMTLSKWKKLPGFWEEVYSGAREIIGDAIPQILESMVKEANRGNVSAAKLCLQTMGLLDEKGVVEREIREPLIFVLSDQEKIALAPPPGPALDGEFKVLETVNAKTN